MTSPLDIRTDAPGMLRTEAMGMTLKFDRTGPTTGRVSWNIPKPAAGCPTDETAVQTYCGIVITADTTSNNTSKLPANGTIYGSDATVDNNLFAGDTIGTSKVVGAFYNDRTTTFFDITGLQANTPYFVSGFPVDCQNRYYREGIHAYSLDYQSDGSQPSSGTQAITFNPGTNDNRGGVLPTDVTGLVAGTSYSFEVVRGLIPKPNRPLNAQECVPSPHTNTIVINGTNAATYADLLNAINTQFKLLENAPVSANPPNTGAFYYDSTKQKLYVWNGHAHVEQSFILQANSPSTVAIGTYWFDTTSNTLKQWDGLAWQPLSYISHSSNPANPQCETAYWFDGTNAYVWTGNAWAKPPLYIQNTNPSDFNDIPCGSFWYNTETNELSSWDETLLMWVSANAVQYSVAPNTLPVGAFWFDDTNKKVMSWTGTTWVWEEFARIIESDPVLTSSAGTLWYNPATMELKQRNLANTAWVDREVIVFEVDPTVVTYCSNWWNTLTDKLNVWDGVHSVWVEVASFYQQDTDPTLPPQFAEGDLWFDPVTDKLYYWQNNCFVNTEYLNYPTDPRTTIPVGAVWHDTTNDLWMSRTLTGWIPIDVTLSASDLTLLPAGTLWMNSSTSNLQQWNGVNWVSLSYTTQPLTPTTGTKWFNNTTNSLMMWNGYEWVIALPPLTVEFNCNGNFVFTDTSTGSLSWVAIHEITLFTALTADYWLENPQPGQDGVSSEPTYQEVGIGTDGTNDERLQLMNEIRYALGYPTVDVELAPEQLNFAIDSALQTLREHSSIAYTRGYFFMNVRSETQKYLLTNKVSGMNKIVDVLGIHRLTSAFLSSAHGAGVYGQIVLQHLYNMGSFDLLSYHIMTEYTKNLEILFAGRITYNWNEQTRELFIHHRFPFSERMCLIEASVERTEQQLISDRLCRPWLRKWAIAESKMMLSQSRGKFSTLPGASGSVSLNSSDLSSQSVSEKELLMAEIFDFVVDTPEDWGIQSSFTFG